MDGGVGVCGCSGLKLTDLTLLDEASIPDAVDEDEDADESIDIDMDGAGTPIHTSSSPYDDEL